MNKKTAKIVLDIIKSVFDRPNVYGVQFQSHSHISGKSWMYMSDGYLIVRLEVCGDFFPLPINDDFWCDGNDIKKWYAEAKTKDVFIPSKSDHEHPDLVELWNNLEQGEPADHTTVNLEEMKKLAPFGTATISMYQYNGMPLVKFAGRSWSAYGTGMIEKVKE